MFGNSHINQGNRSFACSSSAKQCLTKKYVFFVNSTYFKRQLTEALPPSAVQLKKKIFTTVF